MPAHTAPATDRDDDREHDVDERVETGERRADPDGEERADEVLPLAADVEHAAAERKCDGKAREDQRGRDEQGLLEVERRREPVDRR